MKYLLLLLVLFSSSSVAIQSVYPDDLQQAIVLTIKADGSLITCIKLNPTQENIEHLEVPMACHKFKQIELMQCVGMPDRELICNESVGI